jgi:parvulin-like peptidyl-prolyl isomerase
MKLWQCVVVGAVAVVLTLGSGGQAFAANEEDLVLDCVPDGPVALVNGHAIDAQLFVETYSGELSHLKQRRPDTEVTSQMRVALAFRSLRVLIDREILLQEAAKRKLSVPDQEVEDGWQKELKKLGRSLSGDKDKPLTEAEVLKSAGATREEALAQLREAMLVSKVRDAIIAEKKITVSDAEVAKYFEDNVKDGAKRPDTCHLKQLFFRAPAKGADAAKMKEEARKRAETALKRLRSGQSFSAVAKAMSDPPFKDNGGDLGIVPMAELPKFLADAAYELKPGKNSGVVSSEFGFHIVQLVEMAPGKELNLEDTKKQIHGLLMMQRINAAVREFCREATSGGSTIQTFLNLEKKLVTHPELMELFMGPEGES